MAQPAGAHHLQTQDALDWDQRALPLELRAVDPSRSDSLRLGLSVDA
jgi:hypothetical protein